MDVHIFDRFPLADLQWVVVIALAEVTDFCGSCHVHRDNSSIDFFLHLFTRQCNCILAMRSLRFATTNIVFTCHKCQTDESNRQGLVNARLKGYANGTYWICSFQCKILRSSKFNYSKYTEMGSRCCCWDSVAGHGL